MTRIANPKAVCQKRSETSRYGRSHGQLCNPQEGLRRLPPTPLASSFRPRPPGTTAVAALEGILAEVQRRDAITRKVFNLIARSLDSIAAACNEEEKPVAQEITSLFTTFLSTNLLSGKTGTDPTPGNDTNGWPTSPRAGAGKAPARAHTASQKNTNRTKEAEDILQSPATTLDARATTQTASAPGTPVVETVGRQQPLNTGNLAKAPLNAPTATVPPRPATTTAQQNPPGRTGSSNYSPRKNSTPSAKPGRTCTMLGTTTQETREQASRRRKRVHSPAATLR